MTLQLPTLLALLGTALMALAIFAPHKTAVRTPAALPRVGQTVISTWQSEPLDSPAQYMQMADMPAYSPLADVGMPDGSAAPAWPVLIDPLATHCDADARRRIALALGALKEPWCEEILRRALDEEIDADVRLALLAGLDVGELTTAS